MELVKAGKKDFDDAIKSLQSIVRNDYPERDKKIRDLGALQFTDGSWFIARISSTLKPGPNSFGMSIHDGKGNDLMRGSSGYLQTRRSGNAITGYRVNVLMRTVEPVTKEHIGKDRSPVTITASLFKKNEKVVRIYPELK